MNKIELVFTGLVTILDVIVITAFGAGMSVDTILRKLSLFGTGVVLGLIIWYLFIEPRVKGKKDGKT